MPIEILLNWDDLDFRRFRRNMAIFFKYLKEYHTEKGQYLFSVIPEGVWIMDTRFRKIDSVLILKEILTSKSSLTMKPVEGHWIFSGRGWTTIHQGCCDLDSYME